MIAFRLKFDWNLLPRVPLTINQHCLGNGLAPNRRQAITWTNDDPVYWRIYAALGGEELIFLTNENDMNLKCETEWTHVCKSLSTVNSPHRGQWRGALMFSLIYWTSGWVNNRYAGDLRRHSAHYDVTRLGFAQSSDFILKMAVEISRNSCIFTFYRLSCKKRCWFSLNILNIYHDSDTEVRSKEDFI